MLRQALVATGTTVVLLKHFGKAIEEKSIPVVLDQVKGSKPARGYGDEVRSWDFFNYRVTFSAHDPTDTCFIFITDLNDEDAEVKKQVASFKKEFLDLFAEKLGARIDASMLALFDPNLEYYHRQLKPKIALCGYSGVGKTTINRLIRAEEIPVEHVPTITGEIGVIKIGKLHFNIWDFAGQESFLKLWTKFIKGSDAVLIVTDSTPENVERSKYFVSLAAEQASNAKVAVIANKQDLPGALPAEQVGKILGGSKAYGIVANDAHNRDKMINIIADVLEMNAEISPLLKPLIDRDKKMNEAQKALEDGDFLLAKKLFTEISELCLQLGDDKIANELYTRAEKIGAIIASMSPAELELYAPKHPATASPGVRTSPMPSPIGTPGPGPLPGLSTSSKPETVNKPTTTSATIPGVKPSPASGPGFPPPPGVAKPVLVQNAPAIAKGGSISGSNIPPPPGAHEKPAPTLHPPPGPPKLASSQAPSPVIKTAPGIPAVPAASKGQPNATPSATTAGGMKPLPGLPGMKPTKPSAALPSGQSTIIKPTAPEAVFPAGAPSGSSRTGIPAVPATSSEPLLASLTPPIAAPPQASNHEPTAEIAKPDEKPITLVCPICNAFHNIKVPQAAIKQITGLDISNVIVSIPCGATVEIFFDTKKNLLDLRPVEVLQVKYVIPESVVVEKPAPEPVSPSDAAVGGQEAKGPPAVAPVDLSPEEMARQIQTRIQKIETHLLDLEVSFLNEKLPEKQYKALSGKLLSIKEQLLKQLGEMQK